MIKNKLKEIEEKRNIVLGTDLPLVVIDHKHKVLFSSFNETNDYTVDELRKFDNKVIKVKPVLWKPTEKEIKVDGRVVIIHKKVDGYRITIDTGGYDARTN